MSSTGSLTAGTSGFLDSYGYLLDSNCSIIASDDDSGPSANFSLTRTLNAGSYYLAVRHFSGSGTGAYTLSNSFQEQPQAPATPANLGFSPASPLKGDVITGNWNTSPGAGYYYVSFYPDGSYDGQIRYQTATSMAYPGSTSALSSLGFKVRACKQSDLCSPWSSVTYVTVLDRVPANMGLSPIPLTASGSGSFSSSGEVQYLRVTNSSGLTLTYQLRGSGAITDVAVVDGQGIAQTSNVVSSGTTVTFIVSNGETRYVRLTGNAGAYNYTFKRYSNFPPYEGL